MAGDEERGTRSSSDRDGRISRSQVNLKFGHFTSSLCSEGKEMYERACRGVVLLNKPIAFFDVPVAVVVVVS